MAGLCIIWSNAHVTGNERSRRVLSTLHARAEGERALVVEQRSLGNASITAWRRASGEFPHAGRLHEGADGGVVAWLGQAVDDQGDASLSVIQSLASGTLTDDAAARVNGCMLAAAMTSNGQSIEVIQGRFAHTQAFWAVTTDGGILTTDLDLLVSDLGGCPIDPSSLDLWLRTGEFFDDQTMLAGVRFLEGGTRLRLRGGRVDVARYWRYRLCPDETIPTARAAVDTGDLLRRAVSRIARANSRIGVPLSGGLDSRYLLGLCPDPSRVPSFTMGLAGCRDLRFAERFARRVGSPHRSFVWEPELFPPLWDEGVAATAGCVGVGDMYMLPYAERMAQACDVTLNGLAGDALLGGNFVKLAWLKEPSVARMADLTWAWRVPESASAWADQLSTSPDNGAARSAWLRSLEGYADGPPGQRTYEWLTVNRVFRYTNCGTALLRRHVESQSPFFDNDVMDYLARVPLILRYKHRLYLRSMRRACPDAAAVAWQRTGVPPAWGFAATAAAMLAHKLAGLADRRLGTGLLADMKVADPAGWFRHGAWGKAARALLISERCLDRGLLKSDAVRAVVRSHEEGRDESRMLARLITIETLARRLDSLADGAPRSNARGRTEVGVA